MDDHPTRLSTEAQRVWRRIQRGKAADAEVQALPPRERRALAAKTLAYLEAQLREQDAGIARTEATLAKARAARAGMLAQIDAVRAELAAADDEA